MDAQKTLAVRLNLFEGINHMPARILVINPNSNAAMTQAMDSALNSLRTADAPIIESVTIPEGPRGIESQADADAAGPLVVKRIEQDNDNADAYVIACYSDPGIRLVAGRA